MPPPNVVSVLSPSEVPTVLNEGEIRIETILTPANSLAVFLGAWQIRAQTLIPALPFSSCYLEKIT